ncbi:MAG: hypothetical protein AAFO75_05210 [Pseudomonadota bacterium]
MKSPKTLNSTPSTGEASPSLESGEGWRLLLGALTVDELQKYAEIASDQISKEQKWALGYLALLVISLGCLGWVGLGIAKSGLTMMYGLGLALAGLLAYWPYRSMKTKKLWRGHCDAVKIELAKRKTAPEPNGSQETDDSVGGHQTGDEHEK